MSNTVFLLALSVMTLLAAVWAHYRASAYRSGTRLLVRSILLGVGTAFGLVMAFVYTDTSGLDQLLVFLSSLGLVHVPAAVILQLKHLR